jgi:YD repeat-containing protein
MSDLVGGIKLPILTQDPTTNPASGKIFLYVIGTSVKYKQHDGTTKILATGIDAEEVQDIVGNLLSAGSNKTTITYNDVGNALVIDIDETKINHQNLIGAGTNSHSQLDGHVSSTSNPHSVTKTQVGLGNCDNTSDVNKPVSTATQTELNDKVTKNVKTLYVNQQNPLKPGDFGSVAAAAATILNSADENRYVIYVGPGRFLEPIINLPAYVSVVGESIQSTIIEPDTNLHDVFVLNEGCEISFLTVQFAGAGRAAFKMTNCGNFTQLHKVSIYSCDIGLDLLASSIDSYCYVEYVDINGEFTNAIKCNSQNEYEAFINAENFYTFSEVNNGPQFYINGSVAEVNMNSSSLNGVNGTAIEINSGGSFVCNSTKIYDSEIGIHVTDTVGSPHLVVNATLSCSIHDILIENPLAVGSLRGSMDVLKVEIDPLATISAAYADHGSVGQVVLEAFYQGDRHDRLINISKLVRSGAMMGLVSGGAITKLSGLNISIASGNGFIRDSTDGFVKEVTWTAVNSTTLPAYSERYIVVNNSGVVEVISSKPDSLHQIPLGRVQTDASDVCLLEESEVNINTYGNLSEDYIRSVFGSMLSSGLTASKNGDDQVNVTSGNYYFGTKKISITGASPITFESYYKNGSGGFNSIENVTTIDCTHYDNGSGTLASLPLLNYTKHLLLGIGGTETKYFLVYGQEYHLTVQGAESAPLPIVPTHLKDAVIRIASIIVSRTGAEINSIIDERPQPGFRPSAISSITSHGELLDLDEDDHEHYHNDTRGDIRYYTKSQIDTALSGKSNTGHTHTASEITDFNEAAQDAIGSTLEDTQTIDFTYDDAGNKIRASVRKKNTTTVDITEDVDGISASLNSTLKTNYDTAYSHTSLTNNPHSTTKAHVGLGNCDNTSDANKPVSTAQATAIGLKADKTITFSAGTGLTGGGDLSANRSYALANTAVTPGTYGSSTLISVTVDQQGRITSASNGPALVLGDQFENFEDLTAFTTTANTNQVAASFTTTAKPAGKYRLQLDWDWGYAVNSSDAIFEIYLDGTQIGNTYREEVSETTNQYIPWSKTLYVNITGSVTHTIELRCRGENSGSVLTVHTVRAEIWRVG